MKPVVVSVIICTCNRAEPLRLTLEALARVSVPEDLPAELIVVDNGSADGTAEVVRNCDLTFPVKYAFEPRRGKGYAYNRGMAEASGEIFLFTDDDVRPPPDWLAGMCRPILAGQADAVQGGVAIPKALLRPWMEPLHRAWMASTDALDPNDPPALIGANMAFSREVLRSVPAFDSELGPGALGFCDETLFSLQLKESGGRIAAAYATEVEHHFDASRLTRENFLKRADGQGRSQAYMAYHWLHQDVPDAAVRLRRRSLRLLLRRWKYRAECAGPEGAPGWELNLVSEIAYCRQFLTEMRRPRLYDRLGLVKRI